MERCVKAVDPAERAGGYARRLGEQELKPQYKIPVLLVQISFSKGERKMNFPMHLSDFITQLSACLNFSRTLLLILASNHILVCVLQHILSLNIKYIHVCVCKETHSSNSLHCSLFQMQGTHLFWVNIHTVEEECFIFRNIQHTFTTYI